jgi:hypothetical protein
LETHLAFVLSNPETLRISCTAFTIRNSAGSCVDRRNFSPEISNREMLCGCFISPGSTMLVERTAFTQVGLFDDRLRLLEDWDWLLRATLWHPVAMLDVVLTDICVDYATDPAQVEHAIATMKEKRSDYALKPGSSEESIFLSTLSHELAACHYHNRNYMRALVNMFRSIARMPAKGTSFYLRIWRRLRQDARLPAL